ncbi:MAG: hypothetical protein JJT78_10700 [Leptospira sp.]|nr:hypothetical protein [Leptospira sp.]
MNLNMNVNLNLDLDLMFQISNMVATIGWFCLLIGTWAFLDAKRLNLSLLWMLPIFFLLFMLGPIGFILYWMLRSMKQKSISI